MLLFPSTGQILGVESCPGNLCCQWFFPSSSFLISTSSRGTSVGSVSSPRSPDPCARVFAGLTSALLWHICFQTAEICSQYSSRLTSTFVQVEIEDVVQGVDSNELLSSVPTHQSFEVYPDVLANLTVKNARPKQKSCCPLQAMSLSLSRTARNFVYTRESSIQRSDQAVFVIASNLPRSTGRTARTTARSVEYPACCPI